MDNKKLIGQRINSALALRGYKQKDLAKELNVTDNTVSYFCSGSRIPNTIQIIEIAKFLEVSTDYLLGNAKEPTTDVKMQSVIQYTGLSESSLQTIMYVNKNDTYLHILNMVLSDLGFVSNFISNINLLYDSNCKICGREIEIYSFLLKRLNENFKSECDPKDSLNELHRMINDNSCIEDKLRYEREEKDFRTYKAITNFQELLNSFINDNCEQYQYREELKKEYDRTMRMLYDIKAKQTYELESKNKERNSSENDENS